MQVQLPAAALSRSDPGQIVRTSVTKHVLFGTGPRAVTLGRWGGNRRSVVTLAKRHAQKWYPHFISHTQCMVLFLISLTCLVSCGGMAVSELALHIFIVCHTDFEHTLTIGLRFDCNSMTNRREMDTFTCTAVVDGIKLQSNTTIVEELNTLACQQTGRRWRGDFACGLMLRKPKFYTLII